MTDLTVDGDSPAASGAELASSRARLSRERILATAIELIDHHGLHDLSMRRLGAELGVEAMSLYRYVPGREDLLEGVVQTLVAELTDDPEVADTADRGWQDFLQRLAHGIRKIALRHPPAFPLIASRPAEAPWLRPPLRSLVWVEIFLKALTSRGFTDVAAVAAYRAFSSFLLGHLLLEVSMLGADLEPLDLRDGDGIVSLSDYPLVCALRPALAEDHGAAEFEESLENLLDRIELMAAR